MSSWLFGDSLDGAMLSLAREARGVTQVELAGKLMISQSQICKLEKGHAQLDRATAKLAAEVLDFLPSLFSVKEDEKYVTHPGPTLFRKRRSVGRFGQNVAQSLGRIFVHQSLLLEKMVRFGTDFSLPEVSTESSGLTPESIAQITRRSWGLTDAPIANLTELAEASRIRILMWPFGNPHIDAFTFVSTDHGNEIRPTVCLNEDLPADRTRFSLAHEIGHLVMHRRYLVGRAVTEGAIHEHQHVEQEANAFASALLMPRSSFAAELVGLTTERLLSIKRKWRVSIAATLKRAHDLEFMSDSEYAHANRRLSTRGWRTNEPQRFPGERPVLLRDIAWAACRHPYVQIVSDREFSSVFLGQPSLRIA